MEPAQGGRHLSRDYGAHAGAGTGIGLTVARSIATRLGGNIMLDTSYSPGARFVLALPLTLPA